MAFLSADVSESPSHVNRGTLDCQRVNAFAGVRVPGGCGAGHGVNCGDLVAQLPTDTREAPPDVDRGALNRERIDIRVFGLRIYLGRVRIPRSDGTGRGVESGDVIACVPFHLGELAARVYRGVSGCQRKDLAIGLRSPTRGDSRRDVECGKVLAGAS